MSSPFVKRFPAAPNGLCLCGDKTQGDHGVVWHRRVHRRYERYWIKTAEPTWHEDLPGGRGRTETDKIVNRSSDRMCRDAARRRRRRWVGGKR